MAYVIVESNDYLDDANGVTAVYGPYETEETAKVMLQKYWEDFYNQELAESTIPVIELDTFHEDDFAQVCWENNDHQWWTLKELTDSNKDQIFREIDPEKDIILYDKESHSFCWTYFLDDSIYELTVSEQDAREAVSLDDYKAAYEALIEKASEEEYPLFGENSSEKAWSLANKLNEADATCTDVIVSFSMMELIAKLKGYFWMIDNDFGMYDKSLHNDLTEHDDE